MRRCTACGIEKYLKKFSSHRGRRDGIDNRCRTCNRTAVKNHQRANRKQLHARQARYRHNHLDREKVRHAKYRRENGDRQRITHKQWRHCNPDKIKQYNRRGWLRWYPQNRQRVMDSVRQWKLNNPELARINALNISARRRTRQRSGRVSQTDLLSILIRDENRCWLCGTDVTLDTLSFDHVIPLARGGAHDPENLRVAHLSCNIRKGTKLISLERGRCGVKITGVHEEGVDAHRVGP